MIDIRAPPLLEEEDDLGQLMGFISGEEDAVLVVGKVVTGLLWWSSDEETSFSFLYSLLFSFSLPSSSLSPSFLFSVLFLV